MDLDNLLIKEESLWRSKSRETWLTCKDRNIKYFHTSTLIRKRSNAINLLKLDSSVWVSSRDELVGVSSLTSQTFFTSSNLQIENEMLDLFSPIITEEENVAMCSVHAEEKILKALASLGSTKAPGPDGFIALFFKKYWNQVKTDFLVCIEHFFTNNNL